MKKIVKILLSRSMLVALALLLQTAALIIMLLEFSNYFVWFYAGCTVISAITVLWILNSNMNPAYKLAWNIPILLFPIFGGLFYLVFGRSRYNRRIRRGVQQSNQNYRTYLKKNPHLQEEIAAQNLDAGAQVTYLQRYSNCPVYHNSAAVYLPDGETKFRALVDELQKAKHFIFLEYFIIQEGVMWNTVLDILQKKVKQGVQVRVLYDDMGCLFTLPFQYHKKLEKMGIQCSAFNSFIPFLSTLMNNRDHRKIAVIDGHTAITGGINLADEYINVVPRFGRWKDAAVMIHGEAVWNFTVMFLSQWDSVRNITEDFERFRGEQQGQPQQGGYVLPYSDNPLDWEAVGENAYLNLINRAKKYIYINTPYLILDNEMITALGNAAKSGVDVRIVTPHIPDKKMVYTVTRANYEVLLRSGVKIYEYTPGFNHAKTVVCDDEYGIVGTINFDYRSFYMHFECAVWLYRCPMIADMREEYLSTLLQCRQVQHAECFSVRWTQRLSSFVLRIFSPLL